MKAGEKHHLPKRAYIFIAAAILLMQLFFPASVCIAGISDEKETVRISCGINKLLYIDEDGNVKGYCKEYLDALAAVNNWEYEYIDVSWPVAMEMLDAGELDILFPTTKMDERDSHMDYSNMSGGYMASGLFAASDSEYTYEDFESFNGARIAVSKNSSNVSDLAVFAREHGFTYEAVYIDTVKGKIDALNDNDVDMIMFSAANEVPGAKLVSVFDTYPFYYAVKKGNTELMDKINSGMEKLLIDNPELAADVVANCVINADGILAAYTEAEREFVSSKAKIVVGFNQDIRPMAYKDKDGNIKGIYVDILKCMEEKMGLSIELYPIDKGEYWQDLLKEGAIDFYMGDSEETASYIGGYISTDVFMEYDNVLVTRNNYNVPDRENDTIAMVKGRSCWETELPKEFENDAVIYCETPKDCLIALKSGDAGMTLLNNFVYNYQTKNVRFSNTVQRDNYRYKTGACMTALESLDPVIYSVMDKSLMALSNEEIDSIVDTNLNTAYESYEMADYIYMLRLPLIVIISVLVLIATAFILFYHFGKKHNKSLKRQMDIIGSLSDIYFFTIVGDLKKNMVETVKIPDFARFIIEDSGRRLEKAVEILIDNFITDDYKDKMREFLDIKTLPERLGEKTAISQEYYGAVSGWCRFNIIAMERDENGEVIRAVFTVQNIDEEKKKELEIQEALKTAYEAANRANHAKSDFLSKMSHDIRTPMNAIIGMTAIAGAHIDEKERVKDSLDKIVGASHHLLDLINEVLDMSKIESGKVKLAEKEFNLADLLRTLFNMVQPEIKAHGHDFNVYIHSLLHEDVIGDSLRLQQVFVNIISNAIKYTPDNGKISLTVREKPGRQKLAGCYEFIFEDNGIGMSEEYMEKLFDPFTRAEDVRTSKIVGTGLGMSITRNIVQMMNGTIDVKSREGEGSRFTVTIFLKFQDKQDISMKEFEGLPVLVADEDRIFCETACEVLEEIGMSGKAVFSGEEAVKLVSAAHEENKDFYGVILGMNTEGMDGIKVLKAITKSLGKDRPLTILSAYDWPEIELEARAAGADAFLDRPVFKSELCRLFKSLKNGEPKKTEEPQLKGIMESDYSGKRALLVEDNDLNREIAAEFLKMMNMEICEAVNGKEAVDMYSASEEGYYDIILMDIQMPVMNGYDAACAIRSLPRRDALHIPIIAMTANAFVEDIQAATNAGMNEHIAKPVDFNKLAEVFMKYLGG